MVQPFLYSYFSFSIAWYLNIMRKIVSLEIHNQKFSFFIKRICHTDNNFRLQLFSHEAYGPIQGVQNIVRKPLAGSRHILDKFDRENCKIKFSIKMCTSLQTLWKKWDLSNARGLRI